MGTNTIPPQEKRPAAPAAAPCCPVPTRQRSTTPHTPPPAAPDVPSWSHRLLPKHLRTLLADLGCWQDPTPQLPSAHLEQTLAVLNRYGWCQSLDVTPTGRICVRGAQNLLEKTGHVTPAGRERAVDYMQTVLAQSGVHMQFFAWNDLPGQSFTTVQTLLTAAARTARQNGE